MIMAADKILQSDESLPQVFLLELSVSLKIEEGAGQKKKKKKKKVIWKWNEVPAYLSLWIKDTINDFIWPDNFTGLRNSTP
jgi:hypothetical protein